MLESESQQQQQAPRECLISWSESGKAFRIEDVSLFSTLILPKYFRTNKFSSFQRNLNLVSVHATLEVGPTEAFHRDAFWLSLNFWGVGFLSDF